MVSTDNPHRGLTKFQNHWFNEDKEKIINAINSGLVINNFNVQNSNPTFKKYFGISEDDEIFLAWSSTEKIIAADSIVYNYISPCIPDSPIRVPYTICYYIVSFPFEAKVHYKTNQKRSECVVNIKTSFKAIIPVCSDSLQINFENIRLFDSNVELNPTVLATFLSEPSDFPSYVKF